MAVYLGNNKLTFDGISEIYVGSNKVYSAAPPIDYSTEYFFVENLTSSANTLSIKKSNSSAPTITVYRSTDKTTWTSIGSTSTTAITYSIPANSKIYLRATVNNWSTSGYNNSITCSGNFAVGGNIMSLLYGDSFIGKTVFPSSSTYNFSRLFSSQTNLKNIVNLVLPATTLTQGCYQFMFASCTGLTSIPRLPATTLANSCYSSMFSGCTGITSIPLLPATTLTNYCYNNMFNGCTGITSIPSNLLPATTLTNSCYQGMFKGTSITSIPSTLLPATTLSDSCYSSMFNGCTGLTSIPSNLLPATTLVSFCYGFMFNGCTGITSIPSNLLPATTLADSCYQGMFSGCRNITKSPELPATTLTSFCYRAMFSSCSSLNEITCYANSISAMGCTSGWVNGVAASGTFNKMGSANWTLDSVDGIPTGWTVSIPYFYVENLTSESNTLSIKKSNASAPTITVYYSVDKTTWVSMGDTDTTEITYTIPAESKVYLKATADSWSTSSYYNSIKCSGNYAIGDNIMSLLYGDNFTGKTVFPSSSTYNFARLFYNSTNLKNIDNLILPATTLTGDCYYCMFRGTSITTIPSNLLPATTLANNCYSMMFYGCTGLTSIPSNFLPATTLTTQCYSQMFYGCTGLTTIPSTLLHSTTLASGCYQYMFNGCTSLTTIPSTLLHSTTLQSTCYSGMFQNCTGLTKSPDLPATTLASSCYSSMFSGCTSLTTAPELPATTLASSCYSSMFCDCTGITKAPILPATTLASGCYSGMFSGCSSLNEITCYANDISASYCTTDWVYGVAASGTFYKKGTASWEIDSVDGVPTGWTVIEEIPYDPINDYFWVENITDSAITINLYPTVAYANSSGIDPYFYDQSDSPSVQWSTDKITWTNASKVNSKRYFSVPAKTRYYLRNTSGTSKGSTYYYSGNPGSSTISIIQYGWGAFFYNSYSFYFETKMSTLFSPSVAHSIKVGGNIRTILGYGDSGVNSTAALSYTRSYYNKGNSYVSERYWAGLGKQTTTGGTSTSGSGLYFSGIKDASQLYIGSTDVRPDFINTPSDFVGPIYT